MDDVEVMRRLAFVRYLYLMAQQCATRPEPLSFPALLLLHDAVELFLDAAADQYRVDQPREFMGYWQALEKVNVELPEKAAMRRLNRARVCLKHDGLFPSPHELQAYLASATSFFEAAASLVFAREFAEASLTFVVASPEERSAIERAEVFARSGELEQGLTELATAFRRGLLGYRDRLHSQYGRFYPTFDASVVSAETIVQDASLPLRLVSVGIDYTHLLRFLHLAPLVHSPPSHTGHGYVLVAAPGQRERRGRALTDEEFSFCHHFVVDALIKLERA